MVHGNSLFNLFGITHPHEIEYPLSKHPEVQWNYGLAGAIEIVHHEAAAKYEQNYYRFAYD